MKSIGFFNNKGGVGKTTLLCNLAGSLAIQHNKNILVIDSDPQCNASAYLLEESQLENILINEEYNSIDSFYEPIRRGQGYSNNTPNIERSARFGLDLIVGNPKLSIREDLLASDWSETRNGEPRGFQTTYAFKQLLSRLNSYDYIFVDMGPSLGALNRSVLLSVDFFLMPLSVDIFSMMAVKNIIKSISSWKDSLNDAIERHYHAERHYFEIANERIQWKLNFAGYVMQQYRAKKKEGIRQPVGAFERIIEMQRAEIQEICNFFSVNQEAANLGEVPTLSSVVPLSQQAHAPIFALAARDGVVGAHYTRVAEAGDFFHSISENFLARMEND
ncbi:ParA family protein [Marichromatium sp. AB32]|uniref:ParA family protein n=1 Tax=Marichromatium sp. AB32 TaxID=2483363 RepID=UPI000F4106CC|nr:ParA family protein [Marichromatium sp. AB32]RNE89224.1 ParA family protein [Marichromatium sp. AB32]